MQYPLHRSKALRALVLALVAAGIYVGILFLMGSLKTGRLWPALIVALVVGVGSLLGSRAGSIPQRPREELTPREPEKSPPPSRLDLSDPPNP